MGLVLMTVVTGALAAFTTVQATVGNAETCLFFCN
jgi:hypothetical protein